MRATCLEIVFLVFCFSSVLVRRRCFGTQDLIRKLLTVDPKRRITAAEACEHPWLSTARGNLTQHDLGAGLEKLKIFNATRKLRAAIRSVSSRACFKSC